MDNREHQQMGRKHIFVVNGAADFLDVLRELLQDEQYNVTTTNFVPDTFEQIAVLQPDLLMIDLAVGKQAGWDLLAHLAAAANTNEIPVIVFSTNRSLLEEVQGDPTRYGGQRFLSKPMDLDDVLTAVDELIGKA